MRVLITKSRENSQQLNQLLQAVKKFETDALKKLTAEAKQKFGQLILLLKVINQLIDPVIEMDQKSGYI